MDALATLEAIRGSVAADPSPLREARDRLEAVRVAAKAYPDALRTYSSGSLASKLTNRPVGDADGGLVIDCLKHPELGPDGAGELPRELVDDIHRFIRPRLAEQYPGVRIETMKRGLLVRFSQPLPSSEDPTVDLVVALNRVGSPGLWIPNLALNRWDPSHPERHVELFTAGWPSLRHTRRHVVRVAKAQIKQFDEPAVCSFNIAALAWECIELPEPLDRALWRFYDHAASSLTRQLTRDPAGVSEPIKVADRNLAVERFRKVADAIALAIDAGDDSGKVREVLAADGVFGKLLEPRISPKDAAVRQAIASGGQLSVTAAGTLLAGTNACTTPVKRTQSYGGSRVFDA